MTIDQDTPCPHEDFDCMVAFARQTDGEGGPVVAVTMEVKVWCKRCSEPFRFRGLEIGYMSDRPTTSPDGTELRAPIRPEWDPEFGLGVPGYTVDLRDPALRAAATRALAVLEDPTIFSDDSVVKDLREALAGS